MSSIIDTVEREYSHYSGIAIGKVYNIYPESNMVDVQLLDGSRLQNVQVMVSSASSRSGTLGLPRPEYIEDIEKRKSGALPAAKDIESDVIAVVSFVNNSLARPIILGFLFPENNEMLTHRKDVAGNETGSVHIWKHESNVYTKVNDKGEIEINHPSGLYIKIGGNTEIDKVKNWDDKIRPFNRFDPKTKEPSDPAPYIHMSHPSGTRITVDPDGNVDEFVYGDVKREVKGKVEETFDDTVTRTYKNTVIEKCTEDWSRTSDKMLSDNGAPVHHNNQ